VPLHAVRQLALRSEGSQRHGKLLACTSYMKCKYHKQPLLSTLLHTTCTRVVYIFNKCGLNIVSSAGIFVPHICVCQISANMYLCL
jgi:hypothetical protein